MINETRLTETVTKGGIPWINFFNGRLLSGEDLSKEQSSNLEGRRRLGRAIGEGVATGLAIRYASTIIPPARLLRVFQLAPTRTRGRTPAARGARRFSTSRAPCAQRQCQLWHGGRQRRCLAEGRWHSRCARRARARDEKTPSTPRGPRVLLGGPHMDHRVPTAPPTSGRSSGPNRRSRNRSSRRRTASTGTRRCSCRRSTRRPFTSAPTWC